MPYLINAAQLDKFRKNQKNIIILDASWHLANENRNAKEEFAKEHIVGAKFFDLDQFIDQGNDIPNTLIRDESVLAEKIGALGITNDFKIIFYDNSTLHSSCRALWIFKLLGHNPNQLYVLDGGYAAWQQYAGKTEMGESRNTVTKPYSINMESRFVRTLLQMKANLHHPTEQVIDTRHPVRFVGGPEHRPGLRTGHLPGAFSFPYMTMFEADGRFKSLDKIRKQLSGIGVELSYPIISMCGSGMTAAILELVLDLLGHPHHALYDGSWCEWGADTLFPGEASLSERPVETYVINQ